MEVFNAHKKTSVLEALCVAAENYLERKQRILANVKSQPSPLVEDRQAFESEVEAKVVNAQKAVESYHLARNKFETPTSKPGRVTFICMKKTAYSDNKAVPEFSENIDSIVGPLFDEPDFEDCFEKSWRFLFEIGSTKFSYGDLSKMKNGSEWKLGESSRSEYVTHYIYKVKSIFGYGVR